MADRAQTEPTNGVAVVGFAAGMIAIAVLWVAGALSALLSGHPIPRGHPLGEIAAFAHLADPSAGWHGPVGPAAFYWAVTLCSLTLLALIGWVGWRLFRPRKGSADPSADDPDGIEGLADRREVSHAAGPKTLRRRGATLRPSLRHPGPGDVGIRLGASRGVECWAAVEDSITLLGPPRSGKGYNIVIPAILDYPGAVITTSTRSDNLSVTMTARRRVGPVAVFDPERLAAGAPSALRWSPARGCEDPQTAMIRASALCANQDNTSVSDGSYWKLQTLQGVRCLLHAAAVSGRGAASVYEWSLAAPYAKEALQILRTTPEAVPSWATALDSIISSDPHRRDDIWSMVGNAFAPLADPRVLAAVSPSPHEEFDPAVFLGQRGTLYLLGTASTKEHTGTATLVSALIEDVVHTARRLAAASPGARLDPPLGLLLDEAANYPLPSLGGLMSDGGGTGITTMAVLQSLAQARQHWGRDEAQALWDSSIAKVILGGGTNAEDLNDISRMIGERTVRERSETRLAGGGSSWSQSDRQRPIMDPAAIRMLRFGRGLLLLRSARPIMLALHPWTDRPDGAELSADRRGIEAAIRAVAGAELDRSRPGREKAAEGA